MIRNVFIYWREILIRAWTKTKTKLGVAGTLLDFVIAISGAFFYHYYINDGNYNVGETLFGLVIFLVLILFLLIFYIFTTPAMQDSEQKLLIAEYGVTQLKIGIGEDRLDRNLYLCFQSFYPDTDITEMFVQIDELFISKLGPNDFFNAIASLERKDIFVDSKYIGKSLKWFRKGRHLDHIVLKPNEEASALFLENASDLDIIHFGFDTFDFRDDLDKNDLSLGGMYEIHVNVYGKINNEAKYRTCPFVVFLNFERGREIEIVNLISRDTYEHWLHPPHKAK